MNDLSPEEIVYVKKMVKAQANRQRRKLYGVAFNVIFGVGMICVGLALSLLNGKPVAGVGAHPWTVPLIFGGIACIAGAALYLIPPITR